MRTAPASGSDLVALGARVVLGVAFVYLGLAKAADPIGFLKLVRQFAVLPEPFALNLVAALLPWFEIFCGGLLLAGIRPRGAALVSLVLLVVFTTLIAMRALALHRGGTLPLCAIRFDCGCGTGEVLACAKFAENFALVLLALAVLFRGGGRCAIWPERD